MRTNNQPLCCWLAEAVVWVALIALAFSLLGCAQAPEKPIFQTIEVEKPIAIPCPIKAPAPPDYLGQAKGKSVLEKGNAAIAETEELRALYESARKQAEACDREIEKRNEEFKKEFEKRKKEVKV